MRRIHLLHSLPPSANWLQCSLSLRTYALNSLPYELIISLLACLKICLSDRSLLSAAVCVHSADFQTVPLCLINCKGIEVY